MICVFCKKEIETGCDEDYNTINLHDAEVALHGRCRKEYEKLNNPAPQTFREKLRAEIERLYQERKTFGNHEVLHKLIHWIDNEPLHKEEPDPSLAEFKKKLKEYLDLRSDGYIEGQ